MSLQWTFIASFLYLEIFMVIFLLLPFISPTRWNRIFKSRIINSVSAYSNIYFNVFIAILVLLFLDSIREVRKYSEPLGEGIDLEHHPEAEVAVHMKLFRAQRNFYIAGFALFLWLLNRDFLKWSIVTDSIREMKKYSDPLGVQVALSHHPESEMHVRMKLFRSQRNFYIAGFCLLLTFIIRRLVILISQQAQLAAQSQAMERQALSSTQAAQQLLNDGQNKQNKTKEAQILTEEVDVLKEKYEKVKAQLQDTQEELKSSQMDLGSLKKQAESTNREYDRLLNEHSKLQEKVEKQQDGSTKKDK